MRSTVKRMRIVSSPLSSTLLRAIFFGAVLLSALPARAGEAGPAVYNIQSRWIGERHLIVDDGKVASGPVQGEKGRWVLEKDRSGYLIRNPGLGVYLQLEKDSDAVVPVKSSPTDDRGRWIIEAADDGVSIASKATGKFLNIEKLDAPPACDSEKKPGRSQWTSGLWNLAHVGGGSPLKFYKPGQVAVVSPDYGSAIKGDTPLEIQSAGWTEVEVKSWLPEGRFGKSISLTKVKLDDAGKGTFIFPADRFPRGPITITVMASSGGKRSNCHFMLYNEGGVPWNEGAPRNPPPAARGMKQVFLDEFDKGPLSISKDGKGATYMSHKPGGGDFSGIPFGDHENKDRTPFSQVGTYLRIRADEAKGTTGLLASIDSEGQGFTVKAPCYFESRFIAQTAPGTWPGFWVMTNYMIKDHGKKPLSRPSDELDIIEAYGGEGPGTPNSPGYMIHSHYWNQAPDGKKDYTQDRFAGPIPMTRLKGGGGASWYETFHTYGLLVGKEDTVYYCDDIEVARHKTAKLSGSEPFFFFVNLAVGGTSGWKKDLSQYGGMADMYVDYVRVFQGK